MTKKLNRIRMGNGTGEYLDIQFVDAEVLEEIAQKLGYLPQHINTMRYAQVYDRRYEQLRLIKSGQPELESDHILEAASPVDQRLLAAAGQTQGQAIAQGGVPPAASESPKTPLINPATLFQGVFNLRLMWLSQPKLLRQGIWLIIWFFCILAIYDISSVIKNGGPIGSYARKDLQQYTSGLIRIFGGGKKPEGNPQPQQNPDKKEKPNG